MHPFITRNSDGSTQGADPRKLGRAALEAAGYSGAPLLKVIRAKCLDCCCYQPSEVAKCTATGCPLWPCRMGTNPFTNRAGHPSGLLKKPSALPENSNGAGHSSGEVTP